MAFELAGGQCVPKPPNYRGFKIKRWFALARQAQKEEYSAGESKTRGY